MNRYAIYGCGGHGREILPIVRDILRDRQDNDAVVFVSDVAEEVGTVVNGVKVIAFDKLISAGHRDRKVILSLGTSAGRRKLAERCEAEHLQFESVAAASHKRFDNVTVGEGAVFSEFTMSTANVRIGRHFQCNMYSYVAHDCVIGDFVTFAPRVNCNGRIVIEDDVYIGSGAVLRHGNSDRPLRIGRGAVVGMGAIVTKDVKPFTTVVGNPARPMVKS
ncbi:acetyltransferase [Paraburkholderia sp. 1N]|uniref:Acetyltransferase n=1 Tax=Paraburkholderia solitsugae TaxID=2675748 RepID=A0ABX2BS18_9BURK|nr:acetyltransferase [Paraburkholderia solitsugae]NPT42357.1 acetyltransferase [Paraburkholderia solitsugae]